MDFLSARARRGGWKLYLMRKTNFGEAEKTKRAV